MSGSDRQYHWMDWHTQDGETYFMDDLSGKFNARLGFDHARTTECPCCNGSGRINLRDLSASDWPSPNIFHKEFLARISSSKAETFFADNYLNQVNMWQDDKHYGGSAEGHIRRPSPNPQSMRKLIEDSDYTITGRRKDSMFKPDFHHLPRRSK